MTIKKGQYYLIFGLIAIHGFLGCSATHLVQNNVQFENQNSALKGKKVEAFFRDKKRLKARFVFSDTDSTCLSIQETRVCFANQSILKIKARSRLRGASIGGASGLLTGCVGCVLAGIAFNEEAKEKNKEWERNPGDDNIAEGPIMIAAAQATAIVFCLMLPTVTTLAGITVGGLLGYTHIYSY